MIHDSLPNILISRFVLNLRLHDTQGSIPNSVQFPIASAMSFARVKQAIDSERMLGNIGEPIDYDQWKYLNEAEVEDSMQGEKLHPVSVCLQAYFPAVEIRRLIETLFTLVPARKRSIRC